MEPTDGPAKLRQTDKTSVTLIPIQGGNSDRSWPWVQTFTKSQVILIKGISIYIKKQNRNLTKE